MHKKILRFSLKAGLLASALAALPMGANAAGLGRIAVLSSLGQPLRAEVELSASREELSSLSARLASHDAFKQAGIEYVPALSGIKLVIDKRSGGQPVIRLTTDRPINEPFLDLLIELNWISGRLVREYTFLLDPAPEVLARKPAAVPAAKREAAVAQSSPVLAPKQPETRTEEKPGADKPEQPRPAGEGQAHEVKKGEYLRKIAAETQYEGVSLDQMLVAIFRNNKDAFIGNNMHRMKAGKILQIPDRDAVAAVDVKEARKTISVQTADFNAYRQKLASAAAGSEAPKEEAAKQVATGKIGAKVEEKIPAPAEAKDQLKVSKAEAAKEARTAQGKIAALEEDLAAKERALKEAQSRQADLEKNVKELQKLLELKNQNLAELQKQAAAKTAPPPLPEPKKPEAPAPAAAAPAAAPVAEAKPAEKPVEPGKPEALAAKPAEGEKPVEAAKPAEEPKSAEAAKPAEAPKPAEPPKAPVPKKAPPPPPPPPEPDFLDEVLGNPAILGGGVLVLGLLGFIAYRQRQKKKIQEGGEAPPTTTTANLTANSVFGATGAQSVDTTGSSMATDFSQGSISAIDADEGVDPVAEADVYMAYGRDAQAEEILLDALKTDPTRTAIHVKLLEIYAGRKNNKQFETLASDLYAQTGGVGVDWEKAAAMGLKLDPSNPLYGGGAGGEKQAMHTDTTVIVQPGEKQMRDTWTMPGELSQISEAVEKGGTATAILEKPVEAAAAAPAAGAPALDFDLDLGSPPQPVAAPAAPAAAAAAAPAGLDFDLGLDFKPAVSNAAEYHPEATVVMSASAAAQQPAADLALDIKLDEPAPAAADEGMHFDLDLGAPAAPAAPPSAEVVDLEKTLAGGSALDFDFNIGAPPAAPAPKAEPDIGLGAISLDLGQAAAAVPAADVPAGDEVATKLELAKAYEEMGDKEGARELLGEVAKEGNAEQQAKAQSMLAKLS